MHRPVSLKGTGCLHESPDPVLIVGAVKIDARKDFFHPRRPVHAFKSRCRLFRIRQPCGKVPPVLKRPQSEDRKGCILNLIRRESPYAEFRTSIITEGCGKINHSVRCAVDNVITCVERTDRHSE